MDPLNPQVPPVLNKRELASLCRKHQTLIDSAKPILDMLEVSIRDTGYIAILAVASGHLLAAVGDDNLLVQARSQYNIPGAQRSIKTIGASALSMSIVERAPIQITGYEQYNGWFHEWNCLLYTSAVQPEQRGLCQTVTGFQRQRAELAADVEGHGLAAGDGGVGSAHARAVARDPDAADVGLAPDVYKRQP